MNHAKLGICIVGLVEPMAHALSPTGATSSLPPVAPLLRFLSQVSFGQQGAGMTINAVMCVCVYFIHLVHVEIARTSLVPSKTRQDNGHPTKYFPGCWLHYHLLPLASTSSCSLSALSRGQPPPEATVNYKTGRHPFPPPSFDSIHTYIHTYLTYLLRTTYLLSYPSHTTPYTHLFYARMHNDAETTSGLV